MRRMTRRLPGYALAVALLGAIAGCSDDNGSTPATLDPPTGVTVTQTSAHPRPPCRGPRRPAPPAT